MKGPTKQLSGATPLSPSDSREEIRSYSARCLARKLILRASQAATRWVAVRNNTLKFGNRLNLIFGDSVTKPLLFCDTETYCETPITNGTWAYAEKVEITLFTYAFGDGPVQCWDKASGEPMPADLEFALNDPEQQTVWHNSGFDSTVLRFALGIILPPERIIDTMVQAMSHGLPGSLDKLCDIFKVGADKAKHKTGHALVLFFCKPQPFTHNISKDYGTPAERKAAIEALRAKWIGRATPFTHPEKWAEFVEYAKADITSMRELYMKHLPRWNYPNDAAGERSLWALDQVCNQRGVYIDIEFAKAAVRAADRAKISLAAQTQELTSNEVSSATKRDQMIDHIFAEYGISLDNMKKATLNRMLEDPDVPAELKVLLNVRLQATSTSVSKYAALVKGVSSDSRLRGTIQFSGAQRTGRAAGRLFQPQNLPRMNEAHVAEWLGIPVVNGRPARDITDEELDRYFATGIETVLADSEEFFFDEPMLLLSNCVRGSITAPKKKKLVISDLSNIEGRKIAWLCGEEWKLQAFRDFDTIIGVDAKGKKLRKGNDLYNVAYSKSFGVPPETVDKFQRQIGKVQELACLAGNTLVLTEKRGYIAILDVTKEDRVWDGNQWVSHRGLIARGAKPVVNVAGIELTPDHLVLTNRIWKQAEQLGMCESTLSLALATGSESLPLSGTISALRVVLLRLLQCNARAALRLIRCTTTTCAKGLVRAAARVPQSKLAFGERTFGGTQTSYPLTTIGADCLVEYPHASIGATTQKTAATLTTVDEGYLSTNLGAKIGGHFWRTSSRSMGGIWRKWSWIGQTLTRGTNPETCASSATRSTKETAEKCEPCKKQSCDLKRKIPVYDLLCCGPNNRFTVLSDKGPLIVHNCGFQGGVGAFVTFALAFGIDLEAMADKAIGNIPPDILRESESFMVWAKEKGLPDFGLSDKVYVVCNSFKMLWRQAHPQISSYWKELENDVRAAIASPNEVITSRKVKIQFLKGWLRIRLPSGRFLCYPQAQVAEDGTISFMGVNQYTRKWERITTSGGKLLENLTQASARDVFYSAKRRIEDAGYAIVLEVHDEFITEVPDTPEYSADELSKMMATVPEWAPGLPLAAAGFSSYRYKKG